MVKPTIYLPDEPRQGIEQAAKERAPGDGGYQCERFIVFGMVAAPEPGQLRSGPAFHEWRSLIDDVASAQPPGVEAIAPFGFEATADPRYQSGRFTRYFVYLRSASRPEVTDEVLLGQFASSILTASPVAARAFRLVISGSHVTVRDVPGTASLYLRYIPCTSLLDTYSRYLAASSHLIVDGTLLEAMAFMTAVSARRYVYQLTVIAAALFAGHCKLTHEAACALHAGIRESPDRDPATGAPVLRPAAEEDRELLADAVLPLHREVVSHLNAGQTARTDSVLDIHSGSVHLIASTDDRMDLAARRVAHRYVNYPCARP